MLMALGSCANDKPVVVGVLTLKGDIGKISPFLTKLNKLRDDQDVKGILLLIDSPGGRITAGQRLFFEIQAVKEKKPIVAFAQDTCASTAYKAACATDALVATPLTNVGSVGTVMDVPKKTNITTKLEDSRAATEYIIVSTFANNKRRHMLANQTVSFEADHERIGEMGDEFIKIVTDRRPALKDLSPEEWAEGRIFSGRRAYQLGLVDKLGSYSDALDIMVTLLKEKGIHTTIQMLVFKNLDKKKEH